MPERSPRDKDRVDVTGGAIGPGSTAGESVRWTCPFCGLSRVKPSMDGSAEENALVALRTHVVSSEGDGHGAQYEYPPAFDPATLADHVTSEDGGGRGDGWRR